MVFIDNLGNQLSFNTKPKKVISLVPAISETLYDLNAEELIVGITQHCVHPPHFKHTKQIIGDQHKIDINAIKALQPDLIFCNKGENTLEIVQQLQTFTQVYVTNIQSIKDTKHFIKNIGLLLNRRTDADLLLRKIDLKLEDFKFYIKNCTPKKVAYFTGYHPWKVAGNNTYIDEMLTLCKLSNIYQNLEQYSEINPKRIRHDGDPEVLLFPSAPFPFKDEHAFEISEYTNRSSAVFVDGETFSGFGSRLLRAFDYFKTVRNRLDQGTSF